MLNRYGLRMTRRHREFPHPQACTLAFALSTLVACGGGGSATSAEISASNTASTSTTPAVAAPATPATP